MKIPFILIAAYISEEFAVDVINRGADDYILKDRLKRLPTAIHNLIEKFRLEKERQFFLDELIKNEKRYRALVENGADAIVILNSAGKPTYVSPFYRTGVGLPRSGRYGIRYVRNPASGRQRQGGSENDGMPGKTRNTP